MRFWRLLGFAALLVALGCHVGGTVRIGGPSGGSVALSSAAAAVAFRQGIEAAQLGRELAACPYSDPAAIRAWRAGWWWVHGK